MRRFRLFFTKNPTTILNEAEYFQQVLQQQEQEIFLFNGSEHGGIFKILR